MALLSGLSEATQAAAGTQAAKDQKKLQEDLNQFLNLLVTQLKNQDPLEPLDANEFTAQLVQFASVEQQIYQNAHLEDLVGLTQNGQVPSMVAYIGHIVEAQGPYFTLDGGQSEFTYALEEAANEVVFTIKDENGATVFTGTGPTEPGKHNLTWDGRDLNGNTVADGTYSVTVTAFDRGDDLLEVSQTGFGKVTGASVADGQASLFLNHVEVPFEGVLSIKEAPDGSGS